MTKEREKCQEIILRLFSVVSLEETIEVHLNLSQKLGNSLILQSNSIENCIFFNHLSVLQSVGHVTDAVNVFGSLPCNHHITL